MDPLIILARRLSWPSGVGESKADLSISRCMEKRPEQEIAAHSHDVRLGAIAKPAWLSLSESEETMAEAVHSCRG